MSIESRKIKLFGYIIRHNDLLNNTFEGKVMEKNQEAKEKVFWSNPGVYELRIVSEMISVARILKNGFTDKALPSVVGDDEFYSIPIDFKQVYEYTLLHCENYKYTYNLSMYIIIYVTTKMFNYVYKRVVWNTTQTL